MKKHSLFLGILSAAAIIVFILDGRTAVSGAQEGIDLCIKTVIPSLFPFFVFSIILTEAMFGSSSPLLRPLGMLFGIPKGAESILLCGFLGGYPVGAQCISQAYAQGCLKKEDAQSMLAFCSNVGPAFLFGMVQSFFPQNWMIWAIWGIHITSAFLVSSLFPCCSSSATLKGNQNVSIIDGLGSSIKIMSMVCGWIILFRILIAFLTRWLLWILPESGQIAVLGVLELANGCCMLNQIQSVPLRFLICNGVLAFGGFCVMLQTMSVIGKLSVRNYLLGKLLQTAFSLLLSYSLMHEIWIVPAVLAFLWLLPRVLQKRSGKMRPVGV